MFGVGKSAASFSDVWFGVARCVLLYMCSGAYLSVCCVCTDVGIGLKCFDMKCMGERV